MNLFYMNVNGKRYSTRLKRDAPILSPAVPAVSRTHLAKAAAERGNTVVLHGLGNGYWLLLPERAGKICLGPVF